MSRQLDHIVFICDDLERGSERFAELTGVTPTFGGVHASGRTQNSLLRLGGDAYLEILAPVGPPSAGDDDWTRQAHAAGEGRVLTYCLRSATPLADLAEVANRHGWGTVPVQSNGRTRPDGGQLRWHWLELPASPFGRAFPFFIDWLDSTHPSRSLGSPDAPPALLLKRFAVGHAKAAPLAAALARFGHVIATFASVTTTFQIELETPRGHVWL
jgi:hypothetical protein